LILRFGDVSDSHMLVITFSIVLLALGVLILRLESVTFRPQMTRAENS
jgi:hypothetical protein